MLINLKPFFLISSKLYTVQTCKLTVRIDKALSYMLRIWSSHVFYSHSFGQAFDLLVTVRYMCYHTYTPALSTSSSSRGLIGFLQGYLILRGASRLDAFSVYPFQTWLPCYAIGMTTGEPAVRPARSSRTKASSFQISYARAG